MAGKGKEEGLQGKDAANPDQETKKMEGVEDTLRRQRRNRMAEQKDKLQITSN